MVEIVEQRDADRCGDLGDLVPERDAMAAHERDDIGRDDLGLREVGVRQQDRELVSAQPGQDVGLAAADAQCRREAAQELVADGVAELVVDGLEAVEVEHDDRCGGREAPLTGDLQLELLLEAPPVEEAGQEVVVDQVLETPRDRTALGDVLYLVDERVLGRRRPGRHRQRHPDARLVLATEPQRCGVRRDVPIQTGAHRRDLVTTIRLDHVVHRTPDEVVRLAAGDARERGIRERDAAGVVDHRHPDRCVAECRLERIRAHSPDLPSKDDDARRHAVERNANRGQGWQRRSNRLDRRSSR